MNLSFQANILTCLLFLYLFSELPPELRQAGNIVPVNMEDHRHEDFKPTKCKPFSGKGHTLGRLVQIRYKHYRYEINVICV